MFDQLFKANCSYELTHAIRMYMSLFNLNNFEFLIGLSYFLKQLTNLYPPFSEKMTDLARKKN